jgi:glycerophosphoryl diester phosphodiesterase
MMSGGEQMRCWRWAPTGMLMLLVAGCSESEPAGAPAPDRASFVAVPFVSAHRGGAAYAPENTMLAFENAARLGVDDFEADMLATADEVLVLVHDDTLDRTTDCSGRVADRTYAEILECDAAYWFSPGQPTTSPDEERAHPLRGQGVRVPTAAELFAFAAQFQGDYAPTVTIEIKISFDGLEGLTTAGLRAAQLLVEQIQASGIADRIIVQSFNPLAIDTVKLLDPSIRTLYLTPTGALLGLSYASLRGHEFIAPQFESPDLNAALIDSAHALGKQVVPWTADRDADIQQLIDIGVDGIITNCPACLLQKQNRLRTTQLTPDGAGDAPLCR